MKPLSLLLLAVALPLTACSQKEDALGTSIAAPPVAAPAEPTPAPSAAPAADGSAALAGGTGKAQWTAPPTWKVETPSSSMRIRFGRSLS